MVPKQEEFVQEGILLFQGELKEQIGRCGWNNWFTAKWPLFS